MALFAALGALGGSILSGRWLAGWLTTTPAWKGPAWVVGLLAMLLLVWLLLPILWRSARRKEKPPGPEPD